VHFEFQHNVCGRKIYAEGTVEAVNFLAEQIAAGTAKPFNMMDVLRSGKMR
ncbi:MAG: dihydrodipicolinate reductase, partial [Fibrobacter sp.]|nr:dihydrodipicolinate reductase [Fibrobacter sp.]